MNTRAEIALVAFEKRFNDFLGLCDDLEQRGVWDFDRLGYMSAYFESDLMAVTLQTMSADGVFERCEAEVLSDMFSNTYTTQDLREMYGSLSNVIDDYANGEATEALDELRAIDPALCEEYRRLILDACEVVAAADGVAEGKEREVINRLRYALNS